MNGVAVSAKNIIHIFEIDFHYNINRDFFIILIFDFFFDFFFFVLFFFDERGCCKCEKKYTMLVHNLKTSKTGVFDVIKGVNSPPQARKKSVFRFFAYS